MEIGPIFRSLLNHKVRFWLIAVEIALTLAIVANCVNMILDQRAQLLRPTGYDETNLLIVRSEPFAPEFQDDDYVEASYDEDLAAIRAMPGVFAATGVSSIPLSGGGSATGRRPIGGGEEDSHTAPYFVVGTDALATFGVKLTEGRDFVESDFPPPDEEDRDPTEEAPDLHNVLVTRDLAEALFPDDKQGLGKRTQNKSGTNIDTIVGVIDRMHCSWPLSSVAERVLLFPGRPASGRRVIYAVRAEEGMVDGLYTTLETELLRVNEGRLVTVSTLAEIKADTYRGITATVSMLGGLSVLLIVVTSLGIIGLTSFSVTQRTREIGTRRALGATRGAILRYFLVENWLVTGVGLSIGLVLTYALNFALAHWADVPRIGLSHVITAMLALWIAGLLAALAPALRGAMVSPVIATRNV